MQILYEAAMFHSYSLPEDIPSGNQTWRWKMDHLSLIFLSKPPFSSGISQPTMFDEGGGYNPMGHQLGLPSKHCREAKLVLEPLGKQLALH